MNKYKLALDTDSNEQIELEATTFQEAVEESLDYLNWFLVDEDDHYVAVNANDPGEDIELTEQLYEDAQYETIEKLGYFIFTANVL